MMYSREFCNGGNDIAHSGGVASKICSLSYYQVLHS